ncbi:BREX-1 system phosphatase PglZ type A [Salegentibacter sp. JZCK2]|uniref:BREX-1 system phosphatase PglZ type A n=1 Tax=Salegentibacter tibetensis TaxID=2873600 RepID=UPI001CCB18E3|nr:BREX-1 system phosphatase PglZ type A [Salegentibacter tibetensis]MBZ9730880.1 BREX-1 system phosphatase PglZ type A [Salegentibacter tibetensis]
MKDIYNALKKLFITNRIIFWYDGKKEFLDEFSDIQIADTNKLKVGGNEFEVKYKILNDSPSEKFLLYLPYEKPSNEDNWLLDLELANHVFHTDKEAMFLQELGLDYHFKDLVEEHLEFFRSKERKQKLKILLVKEDDHHSIRCKMLAVVFGTETINLDQFVQAYALQAVSKTTNFDKFLDRFNLSRFFWNEIGKVYNYHSDKPSIYDFLLDLFEHNFVLGKNKNLSSESRLVLSTWKNTLPYRDYFGQISEKVAQDLSIEEKLIHAQLDDIVSDDIFRLTDQRIIHELVSQINSNNLYYDKIAIFVKRRKNKFWYKEYSDFYNTIESGALLIDLVKKYKTFGSSSFDKAVKEYTDRFYEVDYAYRKFVWNYRQTKNNSVLNELSREVEKIYNNSWLLPYNNDWQELVDKMDLWPVGKIESQRQFFSNHVKPFLEKSQKLYVIISDAFRYECGVELTEILNSENRFDSSLNHLISSVPSYTQLGMAALLPHEKIEIKKNSESVLVDSMSANGIQGRKKILEVNSGVRATAIKADELMRMSVKSGGEGREFAKKYDLIYIYHNRIDKTGDDKASEERVFDAVEDELNYIVDLLKKIAGLNGNNILITSDHGFIYQNQKLEESDFSLSKHHGEVWKENRRFVIGTNLKGDASTKIFNQTELGLQNSNLEVLIPKSINRLRVKGAGSRFVHGGTTPQEVIIPLIKVSKKRQDTVIKVGIDIIKSADRITTNILPVSFIQQELVVENILAREIKAGIYAEDGELLSDQFTFLFDIEEGSERQREVKHRFHLSKKASRNYKNQRVRLVIEEPLENTNKWKVYKEFYYTLSITFSSDFD